MRKWINLCLLLGITSLSAEEGCATSATWQGAYPTAYCCNYFEGIVENFSLKGSLLYWKLSSDAFQYLSVKKVQPTDTATVLLAEQKMEKIDFSWDKAFRVGLGFDIPCACIETNVSWTHYYTDNHEHVRVNGAAVPFTESFNLLQLPQIAASVPAGQNADFVTGGRLRYDTIDLDFGRWCSCTDCFRLKPFAGFRFAEIADKLDSTFAFSAAFAPDLLLSGVYKASNSFHGAGVRGGVEFEYGIWCNLSVIGKGAASYAWGRNHARLSFTGVRTDGTDPAAVTKKSDNTGRAFFEGSIGLRYTSEILGCYPLIFEALWEQNYLINAYQYLVDTSVTSVGSSNSASWKREDMMLSGLTASVAIQF